MNSYSPHSSCPKCGQQPLGIATKHVTLTRMGRGEAMRRTCQRCGFVWDEAPLDAKERK